MKSGTQAFTKLTASSNVGQANTAAAAGYCMLINIRHLTSEARIKILEVLGKEDLPHAGAIVDEEEDNCDLLASQDFPNHFQSQTAETLLHCTLCEYMSRSKVEFETHLNSYPGCIQCKKQFDTIANLNEHVQTTRTAKVRPCLNCGKEIIESDFQNHMKEHYIFSSFKKALDNPKKVNKKKQDDTNKDVGVKKPRAKNCYTVYAEETRPILKQANPNMTSVDISKKLGEMWKKSDRR